MAAATRGLTATQARCPRETVRAFQNQYGSWKQRAACNLRTYYCDKKTGRESTDSVCHVGNASEEIYHQDNGDVTMILDSGCRRNVAGPRWHAAMQKA